MKRPRKYLTWLSLAVGCCVWTGCGEPASAPPASNDLARNTSPRPAAPPPPPPQSTAPVPSESNVSNSGRGTADGSDSDITLDNDTDDDISRRSGTDVDSDITKEGEDRQDSDVSASRDDDVILDEFGREISGRAAPRRDRDDRHRDVYGGDDDDSDDSSSGETGDNQPEEAPSPQTAEEALAAIEEIGGRVVEEAGTPVRVFLNRTEATDWHMQAVALLPEIAILNISHTKVTDAGLEHLKALKKLQRIYPHGCLATDEGLESLADGVPNLQILR